MPTLAIASLKGGVGKTTVTLGLASAAAHAGVPTLVADLDPQCNATTALDPGETEASIATVLGDPRSSTLLSAIAPSPWSEHLDVLVGAEETESHNHPDPRSYRVGRLERVLGRLPAAGREYGLVLVDCPPSLGQLTRSALFASDGALLITEPTMFAVSGMRRAVAAVHEQAERYRKPRPISILPNRVKPRSVEHQFRVTELREVFGDLLLDTSFPERTAIQQAQGACRPIHALRGKGAKETAELFEQLLRQVRAQFSSRR
ncbi:ParA family protein [Sciscionella marina]|uniref:ParA family protein n=1 Tax=Sciscionella marina TaxID=508770 RepID=UPI00036DBEB7|nr:ParA family protein [Sciscionella marina]